MDKYIFLIFLHLGISVIMQYVVINTKFDLNHEIKTDELSLKSDILFDQRIHDSS